MARIITKTKLDARSIDILNVIRNNASYAYQKDVPKIDKEQDIPKVGEILFGNPTHANEFINALVNRIALVRVQSATFNNPYKHLKKGFLEFGESVEDIFVGIINAVKYDAEKGASREFKRTLPNVQSVFHVTNWRVMYPITIEKQALKRAFTSADGVTNLITSIIDQVYQSAEYDEYLLFKYLLIKAISHGKVYPQPIDTTNMNSVAVAFRGKSNLLPIDMTGRFNESHVQNNTPIDRQCIFMDADFNAKFDVEVLASAFNMNKADFLGRLHLIDDFSSFDNERFEAIREESTGLEEVTADELTLMKAVKGVLVDEEWFQVYDNVLEFDETHVGSGLYWNYWLHVWKTISYSPFANAIVFVDSGATIAKPEAITVKITGKDVSEVGTIFTLNVQGDTATLAPNSVNFVQTKALTTEGIAVQKYGAIVIPSTKSESEITLVADLDGTTYTGDTNITSASGVGDTVKLNKG
mgnify:FL=1|jgi:hypothetical protein